MTDSSFFGFLLSSAFFIGVLQSATPLIFAALAGLISERSGTVQIALEGLMLVGALSGSIFALHFSSAWIGFIFAGVAGMLASLLFAWLTVGLEIDQIIAGTGLNLLAAGIAPFITKIMYNSSGSTPNLDLAYRFSIEPMLVMFVVVTIVTYVFHWTRMGLLLNFAGEEPKAIQAAGYSVKKIRWLFLLATGLLAGLGGATLSLALASSYSPNMTAGRGFIALAALIFGRWKPFPTMLACLFFASVDAIQGQLQGNNSGIPLQAIQALPYIITIIALAGFFGQSKAPKALGQKTN